MKTRTSGAKGKQLAAPEAAESAFAMCQARVDRLEKLNGVIEELSQEDWSSTVNSPYHDAIQQQLKVVRLNWLRRNPGILDGSTPEELGISAKARDLGQGSELLLLRQLEHQSAQTLISMMDCMTRDVPLCEEEVNSALTGVRWSYETPKRAMLEALDAAAQKKEGKDTSLKKGHLSEESVCVLQDWLVDHFEHPYPSNAEKDELVRMTGMSQGQINNWMSNARVRIWRPAVDSLGKK